MARTFFDQVLVTETPRRGSRWMRAASLIVHLVVVLLIFVLPITAAYQLPGIYTALPPVVLASVSKVPPAPVQETKAVPAASAPTVPVAPPEGIQPEVERPLPSVASAPGGLPMGGSGTPFTGVTGSTTITIPPPPEPPAPAPRRVGGDIRYPERLLYAAPLYPPAAQAARIEGIVILEATIDAQGVVQNVSVLRSIPLLDRAAIDAVRQWRYTPTRLNGVAIPIFMTVSVRFAIK